MAIRRAKSRPGGKTSAPKGFFGSVWWIIRWPLALFVVVVLSYQLVIFSSVVWMRWNNPSSTAFLDLERERLASLRPAVQIRQTWVP